MTKQAAVQAVAPVEDEEEDDIGHQDESRADKFKRVGNRRMSRLLREFMLLENLASPNYEFTEAEFEAMFDALESNVARLKDKFAQRLQREAKQRPVFKF